MIALRQARLDEAEPLTDLCRRSKAHWGYDADFMRQCEEALQVTPEAIAAGTVLVATDGGNRQLGVAQIDLIDDMAELSLLFVEPTAMGRGVGRLLLRRVLAELGRCGVRQLAILADPHAAGFYEAMGARFVRMAASDAIPGRELPLYVLGLKITA